MKINLKPINKQVIVITGASSGIGLATARMAARKGARLVLASRSDEALSQLERELRSRGVRAIHVEADVGDEGDVERIATAAQAEFGRIDTWINNAGASIYGKVEEISIDDMRRLFETNFWGTVYGSLTALRHMRNSGGAIINLGSVVSDTVVPFQTVYSASKHAVKGFTDGLRMEVEADRAPISVTLIKPAAIDTPYIQHAKNYLSEKPTNPPPWYAPDVVASAIIRCAQAPKAEVVVGGAGKVMSLNGKYTPRLRDKLFEATMWDAQHSGIQAAGHEQDGLHHPTEDLRERSGRSAMIFESSMYTQAAFHPLLSGLLIAGGGLALASWMSTSKASDEVRP